MKKLIISGIVSIAAASALMAAPITDMVIVIDESGSMWQEIDQVKANAAQLVAQMDALGVQYQLGLVSFGATSSAGPANPEVIVPLTPNAGAFLAGINTLAAPPGGGYEPGFAATSLAMSSEMQADNSFRPEAGTCVILMTDEDADPDLGFWPTENAAEKAAALAAMGLQNAFWFGIVDADNSQGNSINGSVDYGMASGSLAAMTGGQIWDVDALNPTTGRALLETVMNACLTESTELVAFDVHPTSCPNPINMKSKGLTPMAILGTEDFDVTQIDVSTLRVNGVAPVRDAYEDVATPYAGTQSEEADKYECNEDEADGYMDLTLKFDTQALALTLTEGVKYLEITGETNGGTPITGKDAVWVK